METLKKWKERLPKKVFCKVHRSTIVNQNYIEKIENLENITSRVYLNHREDPIEMSEYLQQNFDLN
jgi:DNA-binding LytR/AlgR family response regulator